MLLAPPAQPARRRGAHALPRLRLNPLSRPAVALGSGLLLALAFPPVDAGVLATVALVPLLWTWRGAPPRHAAACGFLFGVGFLGSVLWGLHHIGYLGYILVVVVWALYFAGAGALVAALARRGVSSPFVTAAVWVVFEGLRVRWPIGGLAWAEIGTAYHDIPTVRSLAVWGGVALVSFVVVVVNVFVLDLIVASGAARRSLLAPVAGILAMCAITVGADVARFRPRETGTVRFALLQAWTDEHAPTTSFTAEQRATDAHLALVARLEGRFDLIVFPESAMVRDPETDPTLRDALVRVAREHDAVVLANARHTVGSGRLANANLAYGPGGRLLGVYAKQHLVPFGEYVPLRDALSFVGELRQIPYDFTAGHRRTSFTVAGHRIGTVICYESAYSGLVRDFVRDGAELLVVSTSDRSYGRSGIAATHFASSQMRAVETGRPVLQAAISGVSGVIDANGDARDVSGLFETTVTQGTVATTTGETPFVRFGDWVLLGSGLGLIGAAVGARRGRSTPGSEGLIDSPRRGGHS